MPSDNEPQTAALAAELVELARHAPARLSARLAALEERRQVELALQVPAHARLELLLHVPRPMRIVRSLPDSEFYLTVREVGPADALPLVALGSAQQLGHLLDLESWRRDRFDAERAGAWVALLLEAGEPTIRRFLRATDDDQLSLLFQRWIRVEPIVPEDVHGQHGHGMTETGDELGVVSPDGNYYFRPTIKEHAPAVQRLAQMLFVEEPARYERLVWAALHELPAELEEGALHWRSSRLEEHGFPPFEEALAVYAAPSGARARPAEASTGPDGEEPTAPHGALLVPAVRERLAGPLARLGDTARERVLHELLVVSNFVLVADAGDTGDPEAHRAALEAAAGYIGIALDARAAHPGDALDAALREVPLVELFREGYAQAAELARRTRELGRKGWLACDPRAMELLDAPLRERLEALLAPRPLYCPASGLPRPFRSMAEIDETRVALDLAELVGRIFVERLGLDVSRALAPRRERTEPPRLSTFLLTCLAWHAARGMLSGEPLPADVLADFLREVASRRTAGPDAPVRALEALTARVAGELALEPREAAVLQAFGRACLEELAAECGALDPGSPVDPRFVACLLIAPER